MNNQTADKDTSIELFFKHSLMYTAVAWSGRLFSIIRTPILTRVFSPGDYGVIDLIATSVSLLNFGFGLGLDSAFARHYAATQDEREKKEYFGSSYLFRLIFQSLLTIILYLNAGWIAKNLLGSVEYRDVIIIASLSLVPSLLKSAFFALLRFSLRARILTVLSILSIATNLIFVVLFVVWLDMGIIGIYVATIVSDLLFTGIAGFFLREDFSLVFSLKRLREMLGFGLPLVPATLSNFVITYSDRYFINHYLGLDEVGLYGIANRISGLLMLLVGGFRFAWAPYMNSTFMEPDANERFRRIFNLYSGALFLLATTFSIFAVEIIQVFTTSEYIEAYAVTPLVLFALVIFNVGAYFPIGIGITRRTYHRTWIGFLTIAVSLLSNFFLIPEFNMMGAGIARCLGYSFYCGMLLLVSELIYPVGYQIARNVALWVLGGLVVFGVYSFQSLDFSLGQVLWKCSVALVVVTLPFLFSVISTKDFQSFYRMLNKYKSRLKRA